MAVSKTCSFVRRLLRCFSTRNIHIQTVGRWHIARDLNIRRGMWSSRWAAWGVASRPKDTSHGRSPSSRSWEPWSKPFDGPILSRCSVSGCGGVERKTQHFSELFHGLESEGKIDRTPCCNEDCDNILIASMTRRRRHPNHQVPHLRFEQSCAKLRSPRRFGSEVQWIFRSLDDQRGTETFSF